MAYKYFVKTDKNKETVGTVDAPTGKVALRLAAQRKQLSLKDFIKIFKVEKLEHGK